MKNMTVCSANEEIDIHAILKKYDDGSTNDFFLLINILSDPNTDVNRLLVICEKLKHSINLLGKKYDALTHGILAIDWTKNSSLTKAYISLIVHLLSAHAFYLKPVMQTILSAFIPKTSLSKNASYVLSDTRENDKKNFIHMHFLLQKIHECVPMTSQILFPLLEEKFPYLSQPTYLQECYVNNLLQIMFNIPKYQLQILEILIMKILQLDLRSPREDILSLEDDEEEDTNTQFDMDEIDKEVSKAMKEEIVDKSLSMQHKHADNLDVLMTEVFVYITGTCYSKGDLNVEATKKLYFNLLNVFEKVILPTYACCHIQFFMFYICSFNERLTEGFVDYLLKKVQSPSTEPVFRQTAVAYVASFIARALYIKKDFVQKCLLVLVKWSHEYIKASSLSSSSQSFHHKTFYSVCQAIFYIFAFRHGDLIETEKDLAFARSLHLQNLVTCRFNPLKYCLPLIATTFSSITRMRQIAFCDTIIERNKRNQIPFEKTSFVDIADDFDNPLDSFFPFDPYLLKRSGKYIHPLYREYEGILENEEDEIDEEKHYEENIESHQLMSLACSPVDLMMFGTSPGFKSI